MRLIAFILSLVAKCLYKLRYKVTVKGYDGIKKSLKHDPHSILFLANHVSHIEPLILLTLLSKFHPRPFIFDEAYRQPIIKQLADTMHSISVPNFEKATNSYKKKYWDRTLKQAADDFNRGDNLLVYPSGQLKRGPAEKLSGASGVYQLLQNSNHPKIVLIRISGFWGSAFSCAFSKESPPIWSTMFQMMKYLLLNGIFFMPRRKVTFEFELADVQSLKQKNNIEFNAFLANWFNASFPESKEPFYLVSYTFWKKTFIKTEPILSEESIDVSKVDNAVKEKVVQHLKELAKHRSKEILPEHQLGQDLGLDSLDVAELVTYLEQQFAARSIKPEEIKTVAGAMKVAGNIDRIQSQIETSQKVLDLFFKKDQRRGIEYPDGPNLISVFICSCLRQRHSICLADEATSHVLTYERMLLLALLFSCVLRQLPKKHIGVLLPASMGAYVTIFAILLADKVPVMMNWTQGAAHLNEAAKLTEIDHVLTSKRFVDGVQGADFGVIDECFVFLEDLKAQMPLWQKLKKICAVKFFSKSILKRYESIKKTQEAVILFTSGTEGPAKGVPLTHENLMENQKAALKEIPLRSDDCLYGCLPPFHSFGFNVTGLFPILCGMKVVFTPNPLDSSILKQGLSKWKITLFCAAPSFLQPVLTLAEDKDLASVRMIISGAEAPSSKLLEMIKQSKKEFIEGYGITECSPMLTINHLGEAKKGVGKPLSNIDLVIVNEETKEKVKTGEKGIILVHGPSVFWGYLGTEKDPFITVDGQKYYNTGDIGYLDQEGYLFLTGREKRTVKIGAEMISLTHLEGQLNDLAKQKGWKVSESGNTFVIVPKEQKSKMQLNLFSASNIDLEQINSEFQHLGYSNIIRFSSLIPIDFVPLMGSGKVDYRKLEDKLNG
jgi:long-chain-fatty-acid--[acyl-carrier-protein] ligase